MDSGIQVFKDTGIQGLRDSTLNPQLSILYAQARGRLTPQAS
jgi:hypothetical protein